MLLAHTLTDTNANPFATKSKAQVPPCRPGVKSNLKLVYPARQAPEEHTGINDVISGRKREIGTTSKPIRVYYTTYTQIFIFITGFMINKKKERKKEKN